MWGAVAHFVGSGALFYRILELPLAKPRSTPGYMRTPAPQVSRWVPLRRFSRCVRFEVYLRTVGRSRRAAATTAPPL